MIIDSSAIIAVLNNEPERPFFTKAIAEASSCFMSTASFVETSIVLEHRFGYDGVRDFDLLISKASIALAPVDADQANIARQAFKTYGKGRHPAQLNFGDCFSYALAKARDEVLLFKGNDFNHTDVKCYAPDFSESGR